MEDVIEKLLFVLARYMHVVAMAVLVGGTLFYEAVVPVAIDELKHPSQLSVFARARWVFRSLVVTSAVVLLISGVISAYRNWPAYDGREVWLAQMLSQGNPEDAIAAGRPMLWVISHFLVGTLGLVIAVVLVLGPTPPTHSVRWMRLNLLILLVAIFLASATRHIRLSLVEMRPPDAQYLPPIPSYLRDDERDGPTTGEVVNPPDAAPATEPSTVP